MKEMISMKPEQVKKLKMAVWFITPWLILYPFICYLIDRSNQKDFKKFNQARFSGRIAYIDMARSADQFRLDSSQTYYRIRSEWDSRFGELAKIGDSVFKPANSDTLILVRAQSGEKYIIVSRRPW